MNPDPKAWRRLTELGAAQLSPGFADDVMRLARAERPPSLVNQFMVGAAASALCFLAVTLSQTKMFRSDSDRILADWQQIASATDDSGLGRAP